jgi:hypothetical protein
MIGLDPERTLGAIDRRQRYSSLAVGTEPALGDELSADAE